MYNKLLASVAAVFVLCAAESALATNYVRCDYCNAMSMRNKALASSFDDMYVFDREGTGGIRRYLREVIDEPGFYQVVVSEIPAETSVSLGFASFKQVYDSVRVEPIYVPPSAMGTYTDINGNVIPLSGVDLGWSIQAQFRAERYVQQQIANSFSTTIAEATSVLTNAAFQVTTTFADGSTWTFDVTTPMSLNGGLSNNVNVETNMGSGHRDGMQIPTSPGGFNGFSLDGPGYDIGAWIRAARAMGIVVVDNRPDLINPTTIITMTCTTEVCYIYVFDT